RRTALALMGSALLPLPSRAAADRDPAYLRPLVAAGKIPRLELRLPHKPRVVNVAAMGRTPGKYGGVVRMLIGGQRDLRLMTLIGYQRLIGYDEKLNFQPDVLEDFKIEDDRIFDFKLRDGHK